jgi:hypothetical protein
VDPVLGRLAEIEKQVQLLMGVVKDGLDCVFLGLRQGEPSGFHAPHKLTLVALGQTLAARYLGITSKVVPLSQLVLLRAGASH